MIAEEGDAWGQSPQNESRGLTCDRRLHLAAVERRNKDYASTSFLYSKMDL